jgi:biopolymer transport protein ExbD
MKKKKRGSTGAYADIEINVMPFVDVFSLLNTFLLMSAAFLSIGILEVQVPFLAPEKTEDKDRKRNLDVNVDMLTDKIIMTTRFSMPPEDKKEEEFPNNKTGIEQLHNALVNVRIQNKETDKVTLFTDEQVTYKNITEVLDAIKLRKENDPIFQATNDEGKPLQDENSKQFLYPKVVLGSVIL